MEVLKNWITGVTAASILVAAAVAVTPKGSMQKMVRLVGGLVLFLVLIAPLKEMDSSDMAYFNMQYRAEYENYEEKLIQENSTMIKTIIEDKTRSYILQKADELGIACDAEVNAKKREDGYPYPDTVTITVKTGTDLDLQKELTRIIESELGVPYENQKWRQTEDE